MTSRFAQSSRRSHRLGLTLLVAAFILLASGCAGSGTSVSTGQAAAETESAPVTTTTPTTTTTTAPDSDTEAGTDGTLATDGGLPPAEFPTGIVPARIEIPAIDVDATIIDLDLRGAEPEVPEDFADTGWYTQTRLPGEIGPAVIAGHVDSVDGPAVFARLSLLEPGDEITVTAADGEQRSFVVADSGQYPKTNLPDEVFGFGQPVPELRLITCGGTFDGSVRHYVDNFVVYAVSSSQSPSAL